MPRTVVKAIMKEAEARGVEYWDDRICEAVSALHAEAYPLGNGEAAGWEWTLDQIIHRPMGTPPWPIPAPMIATAIASGG